jgi:hypothetical protein
MLIVFQLTIKKEQSMSRVAELQARIKEAQAELDNAKLSERADALKRIKEEIKFYEFKATDFKGLLKSRVTQKQVDEFVSKKAAEAKKAVTPKKVK